MRAFTLLCVNLAYLLLVRASDEPVSRTSGKEQHSDNTGGYAMGNASRNPPSKPEQLELDSLVTKHKIFQLTHRVDLVPREGFVVEADGLLRVYNGTHLCDHYDGVEGCVGFGAIPKQSKNDELLSMSTHHVMDLAMYNYQDVNRKLKIETVHTIGAIGADVSWRSNDCGRKTSGLHNLQESIACSVGGQTTKVLQMDLAATTQASKQCAKYSFVLPYTADWRQAKFNWIINAPATLGDISLVAKTSRCATALSTIPNTETLQQLAATYLGFSGVVCAVQYLECAELSYTIGGVLQNALSCTGDLIHNNIDGRSFAVIEACSTAGY